VGTAKRPKRWKVANNKTMFTGTSRRRPREAFYASHQPLLSRSLATADTAPGFDIRHYLRILRRRRLLIVGTAVAIFVVALAISLMETPRYSATAEIVFTPTAGALTATQNTVSFDPARDVQTQIAVMTSDPVRKQVAAALHLPAAPPVAASAVLNTNAIEVTASSDDPVVAARVANGYANAYIDFRKNQTINGSLDAEQAIQTRITDLQHQIDALTTQINAAPPSSLAAAQASLGPQRDALLAQQGVLKQQLDQSQLQSALANTGAQLRSPAAIPSSPSSPHPVTSGISALILGLFAGVCLAFLVDFIDDSVKSHEDAERAAFGLATLGMTPGVPGWKKKGDPMVVSLTAPASPAAEAYRGLRTALQFATLDHSLRVVQVTSPGASEGKTTTLANLAVAFGRSGARVCAVDCDLRRPRLNSFFGTANEVGLTSVANGELPLSRAIQETGAANVSILASGPPPLDPSELLASSRTAGILASLASQFDIVLVDSPPVLPVTDAAVLARRVDALIIVVDTGRTKRKALTRAMEILRQVDAPLLGLVVNRSNEESGYGYSYSYDYRYRDASEGPAPGAGAPAPAHGLTRATAASGPDPRRSEAGVAAEAGRGRTPAVPPPGGPTRRRKTPDQTPANR
jgi:succinoglycan biosynthesis transport protein ExoP